MPEPWQIGGFGIYVHWPFCEAKCPYCDFNSHVASFIDHGRWREAFVSEIRRQSERVSGRVVSSVFFGGGTPSLMEPKTVEAVLNELRSQFIFANDVEITLEANPSSVEREKFSDFRESGVNRVSLGVQALNDADLKRLGRLHNTSEAMMALDIAKSTFDRVSFDLIYARQHQTESDWQSELTHALSFAPDHLSLYQLTIEDGTAFGDRYKRGRLAGLPSEERGATLYDMTQELCEHRGYSAYEVSNHAQTGSESRHNLIYWSSGDYLGIGPGAHGRITLNGARIETVAERNPTAWLKQAEGGKAWTEETLTSEEWGYEQVLMGLRLKQPLDLTRLKSETGLELPKGTLDHLESQGFIRHDENSVRVTARGRPLLNAVISELLTNET